jgi:hypothetical protein
VIREPRPSHRATTQPSRIVPFVQKEPHNCYLFATYTDLRKLSNVTGIDGLNRLSPSSNQTASPISTRSSSRRSPRSTDEIILNSVKNDHQHDRYHPQPSRTIINKIDINLINDQESSTCACSRTISTNRRNKFIGQPRPVLAKERVHKSKYYLNSIHPQIAHQRDDRLLPVRNMGGSVMPNIGSAHDGNNLS